jgi:uncharacterized protein (DUF58 family)
MALTGRAALAALAGVVVVVLAPLDGWMLGYVAMALAFAVGADVALAGSPRSLALSRGGATSGRLAEPVAVVVTAVNHGRRRLRGVVRDAWPPSACATPRAQRVDLPAGGRARLTTTLVPTRRGERRGASVTIRSFGPLGLAARQRNRSAEWAVMVLPPFTSRRFLPEKLARLRQLDGSVVSPMRGQGTACRRRRPHLAPRARPAAAARPRHRPHVGRAGRRGAAVRRLDRRRLAVDDSGQPRR